MALSVGVFQRPVEYKVNSICVFFKINEDNTIIVNLLKKDEFGNYKPSSNLIILPIIDVFDAYPVIFWQDAESGNFGSFGTAKQKYKEFIRIDTAVACASFAEGKLTFTFEYMSVLSGSDVYYNEYLGEVNISRTPINAEAYSLDFLAKSLVGLFIEKEIDQVLIEYPDISVNTYDIACDYNFFRQNVDGTHNTTYCTVQRYMSDDIKMNSLGFVNIYNVAALENVRFFY